MNPCKQEHFPQVCVCVCACVCVCVLAHVCVSGCMCACVHMSVLNVILSLSLLPLAPYIVRTHDMCTHA